MAANACQPKHVATAVPIPPDRMDCPFAEARPKLIPEYKITWADIETVTEAQAAHEGFISALRKREAVVTDYILMLEAGNFQCASDAQWLREREAGL